MQFFIGKWENQIKKCIYKKKNMQNGLHLIVQMKGGGHRNVMIKKQLKKILSACWLKEELAKKI